MKILSLTQNKELLYIKLLQEEFDATETVYITFNEEQFEAVPNEAGIVIFDLNQFAPSPLGNNTCSFEYNRKVENKETGEITEFTKSLGLGKLEDEEFPKLEVQKRDDYYIMPFFTKKRNLRIKYSDVLAFHGKQYLEKISSSKTSTTLTFTVNTQTYPISNAKLVLLERENLGERTIDVSKMTKISKSKSMFKYRIEAVINWEKLEMIDDIHDAYVEIEYECSKEFPELSKRIRLGKTRYLRRMLTKNLYIEQKSSVLAVHPYFTDKYNNISFTLQNIDLEAFNIFRNEKITQKDVILIGERPYKAQDTGFALFKQLRTTHPDLPVYYIIDYDSPEYENVKPYGNTLNFGSVEHVKKMLEAKTIYCSHHFYHLYPFRHEGFEKKIKARKIFIQHGVLGVKFMDIYDRSVKRFDPDLFVVSSQFEKEMVTRSLHYNPDEVVVTGLSRYDTLFDGKSEVKNQIVVIPTWRDWLSGKDQFLNSKYFEYYHQIINDEELNKMLSKTDTKLIFCLHPNMQRFTQYFESKFDNVKLISQGEVNVQDLIKESKMMITDYSSVAFDFAFLGKPVVYFQFDRNKFLGKRGSMMDLDENLPGKIVFSYDKLISQVKTVIESDFVVDEDIKKRTKKFLEYKDLNNSERILALADVKLPNNKVERWYKQNEMLKRGFVAARKSKLYFPLAKRIYPVLKLLPIKENYIVFESGVGRQVADSPREIYEHLVKTDGGKYTKIWAYNGKTPITDKNTKVVKRLSPMYYYYLATSKYWVNNQNFPFYITARNETQYLQTWHGTPLKRMLFDLDEIHGRDEGYLERVTQAKDQWTMLLAQSDYAEEKFRSAFDYKGKVLKVGYPRNDVLFTDTSKQDQRLKSILNIPDNKKIVLYAPTFRDDAEKKGNKFSVDLKIDFENFVKTLGPDYVLLLRFHVITSNKVQIPEEYRDNVKNVSNYPEIQDLYKISDCLITDYSSVFFDYINLKKPMLFYAYDLEKYEEQLRGFYLDYKQEVPGPVITTEEQLYQRLSDLDQLETEYAEKIEKMARKYAPYDDADSTKRVIDEFFGS